MFFNFFFIVYSFITVVEPGSKAWTEIREHFGSKVFNSDSTLNRKALAEIVFNDAEKRRILNGITHPKIQKKMFWELVKCFFKGKRVTNLKKKTR